MGGDQAGVGEGVGIIEADAGARKRAGQDGAGIADHRARAHREAGLVAQNQAGIGDESRVVGDGAGVVAGQVAGVLQGLMGACQQHGISRCRRDGAGGRECEFGACYIKRDWCGAIGADGGAGHANPPSGCIWRGKWMKCNLELRVGQGGLRRLLRWDGRQAWRAAIAEHRAVCIAEGDGGGRAAKGGRGVAGDAGISP
jgi:hypothetical protein